MQLCAYFQYAKITRGRILLPALIQLCSFLCKMHFSVLVLKCLSESFDSREKQKSNRFSVSKLCMSLSDIRIYTQFSRHKLCLDSKENKWASLIAYESVFKINSRNFKITILVAPPYPSIFLESQVLNSLCCQPNESLMILKENLALLIIIRMPLGMLQDSAVDKGQSISFVFLIKQCGTWKSCTHIYFLFKNVLWRFLLF